jgi:hypothetical protein
VEIACAHRGCLVSSHPARSSFRFTSQMRKRTCSLGGKARVSVLRHVALGSADTAPSHMSKTRNSRRVEVSASLCSLGSHRR